MVFYVRALGEVQSRSGTSEVKGINSSWWVWGRLHGGCGICVGP